MEIIFADMFSREPYIVDNDYYYFNPHYEKASDEIKRQMEQIKSNLLGQGDRAGLCKCHWESRTLNSESPLYNPNLIINIRQFSQMCDEIDNGVSKINEVFYKIATEGKPFMDISSSCSWGLIPFIVEKNQQIQCIATDIDAYLVRILREYINHNLSEYNIDLASFDNCSIPIKDNSLDYVTSTFGIASAAYDNAPQTFFDLAVDKGRPINEIYRILKPDGCYVAIEHYYDWKFDLAKTREACERYGKLFGTYSYNEIEEVQNNLKSASTHNQFIAAGFQVEIGEKYPISKSSGITLDSKDIFFHLMHIFKIHEWTDDEKEAYRKSPLPVNTKSFDEEAKNFGIEITHGEIFYVLRKRTE